MATEKQNNNKHIRILIEIITAVALCVAGFVIVRERTKTNTIEIAENGIAIKELIKMRGDEREEVLGMKGDIREIRIEQRTIKEGITRIEKKL
jgi:hypothetical protein